jgi:hypothetical protein
LPRKGEGEELLKKRRRKRRKRRRKEQSRSGTGKTRWDRLDIRTWGAREGRKKVR